MLLFPSTFQFYYLSLQISSDCFLTIESADSINHDLPVFDAGGVTIPAHSEDTQFSI